MTLLVDKYSPKSLNEVMGQDQAIQRLEYNIKNKIPSLIHGETGTGKTSSVYALANDISFEVLEINASNLRNKAQINSIIGGAAQQQSLFKKGKIILVDELDGISGQKDRGGLQALNKLLPLIQHPIVLISNDIWNKKFSTIRKKFELLEFKRIHHEIIFETLKEIASKEKIKFNEQDLKTLSRSAKGDLRAALTDLQISIENNKLNLNLLSEREQTQEIFNALKLIFKTLDPKIALSALDNLKENLDDFFMWLDENIVREYSNEDLKKAFDIISKADIFRGRIRRQQYYRFMVYQIAFLTAGVALSKKEKNPGFVSYTRPNRILKMFISKMRNSKKLAISKALAEKTHTSTKKIMQNFGYYRNFLANNDIINELELTEDEIRFLKT
ncbi:MAG: hypothetical protein CMH62_03615 [Nanoarchaeota archaeon]|nr:hypothetical protein [Nanoarchaeota archaeon]|tara:strand:+ start:537 stop:1697 length:1161 start_codon:yes stop_codon:yes gene_type:complete